MSYPPPSAKNNRKNNRKSFADMENVAYLSNQIDEQSGKKSAVLAKTKNQVFLNVRNNCKLLMLSSPVRN